MTIQKKKKELETGINSTSKKKITFETFTTSLNINEKLETSAPKHLLELFQSNKASSKIDSSNEDIRRTHKNKTVPYLDILNVVVNFIRSNEDNSSKNVSISSDGTSITLSSNIKEPPSIWNKAKQYCSQSTLQLSHLYLSFTIPSNNSFSTIITASTSIKIYLPEKIAVSALPTAIENENLYSLKTKIGSSTLSIAHLAY